MTKIAVTNRIHPDVRDRLARAGEVVVNEQLEPWTSERLREELRDATAMIGFMTDRVDANLLDSAPRLRVIACALKGFDSYDVAACSAHGVWISIVPDLLTAPTAELAIGLAIGLARHLRAGDSLVRSGEFQGWRAQLYGTGLAGATVAIVGIGKVGRAIIDRLQGFGCARVLGVDPLARDPRAEAVPLDTALALADYLFVAAPLAPGSLHLIDAAMLARAKPGQLVVNVGRGSVVDEAAIAQALSGGRIGGYAADVFALEDWALPDRPARIPRALLEHPATLFTPHLGSAVAAVRLAIEHRAADNVFAALAGRKPPDAINDVTALSS